MKRARPVIVVLIIYLSIGALITLTHSTGERENFPKNKCIDNLRLIDGAKQSWMLEHHKSEGDVPTWADINPYITRSLNFETNPTVKCPKGGTYTIGDVASRPTCSIPGHVLP